MNNKSLRNGTQERADKIFSGNNSGEYWSQKWVWKICRPKGLRATRREPMLPATYFGGGK